MHPIPLILVAFLRLVRPLAMRLSLFKLPGVHTPIRIDEHPAAISDAILEESDVAGPVVPVELAVAALGGGLVFGLAGLPGVVFVQVLYAEFVAGVRVGRLGLLLRGLKTVGTLQVVSRLPAGVPHLLLQLFHLWDSDMQYRKDHIKTRMKVIVHGPRGAGRLSLCCMITKGTMEYNSDTVPIDFFRKRVSKDNVEFDVDFWNVGYGAERHPIIQRRLYADTDVMVLCYDVSDSEGLQKLGRAQEEFNKYGPKLDILFVACKCDLEKKIPDTQISQYIDNNKAIKKHFYTSSVTGDGIKELSSYIADNYSTIYSRITRPASRNRFPSSPQNANYSDTLSPFNQSYIHNFQKYAELVYNPGHRHSLGPCPQILPPEQILLEQAELLHRTQAARHVNNRKNNKSLGQRNPQDQVLLREPLRCDQYESGVSEAAGQQKGSYAAEIEEYLSVY